MVRPTCSLGSEARDVLPEESEMVGTTVLRANLDAGSTEHVAAAATIRRLAGGEVVRQT